jgi:branched-chain amino acid transport system permease protein
MNTGMNFWMALLLTSCLVAFLSILVGMPSLRLRGPFFVIITLGFSVIFVSVIKNLGEITGGVVGLMGIPLLSELNIMGMSLESKTSVYYFVLACMILIALITYRIKHSSFGKGLIALSEDEDLCKSVGMNTMLFKTKAFVLSSVIASFAGILYASYLGVITPNDASYHQSFDALVYLTVGGVGTLFGSIIGPALMLLISEALQGYGEFRPFINGIALILLIIFLPKGIAGVVSRFIKVI